MDIHFYWLLLQGGNEGKGEFTCDDSSNCNTNNIDPSLQPPAPPQPQITQEEVDYCQGVLASYGLQQAGLNNNQNPPQNNNNNNNNQRAPKRAKKRRRKKGNQKKKEKSKKSR